MRGQSTATAAEKAALLTQLGTPTETVAEVVTWIDDSGGLLQQLGGDKTVCALVNSVHDGAWFRLPGNEKLWSVSLADARGVSSAPSSSI